MVFRVISLLSVLGLLGRLTYLRYKKSTRAGKNKLLAATAGYFSWVGRRTAEILKPAGRRSLQVFYNNWLSLYPTPWLRWAFIGLSSSFVYLAASGFAFAVFSSRGMYGLPLLVHVVAGGIFSVCLAVVVVFRAQEYISFPSQILRISLFWLFVLSGLSLVATALFSMLPYFTFSAQVGLIDVHRYSALVALLSTMAFLELASPSRER